MRKICQFAVWGFEACPWSVPFVGRNGGSFQTKKSKPEEGILNLPDWQKKVETAAKAEMAASGAILHAGPTRTHIEFFAVTPPGRRHGELWTVDVRWNPEAKVGRGKRAKTGAWVKLGQRRAPDLLNLFKGTEDAIENVTYGNDVQTSIISSSRWYGPQAGVRVTVYAIEPGDFPGSGEPVPEVVDADQKTRRRRPPK